jgi:hypothetical protein
LTRDKALNLYYQYSAQADNLAQTAQIASQNGWNWDAIRFMLAQSQWFAYIKKKVGRALALKALNVAIADGTDYTAPGMDYEKNYVELAFARQGYELYLDSIGLTPTVREKPFPEEINEQKANNTQQNQRQPIVHEHIPQKPIVSQPNNDYYFGLG